MLIIKEFFPTSCQRFLYLSSFVHITFVALYYFSKCVGCLWNIFTYLWIIPFVTRLRAWSVGLLASLHTPYYVIKFVNNNRIFPHFLSKVPLFIYFCPHLSTLHLLHYVAFRNVFGCLWNVFTCLWFICLAHWFLSIGWCINQLTKLFSSSK